MTTYHFTAQALTPIHIGCGKEIDPTEFMVINDKLIQYNVTEVIGGLTGEERRRFNDFLERADLKEIQNFLRHHLDEKKNIINEIDSSKLFRMEFETKASNPNNQFKVEMMPRNPHTGQVYIPGSSIKGAIRTAIINHFTHYDEKTKSLVHKILKNEKNPAKKGKILEQEALNLNGKTESDVFRFFHVEDALLPPASTRIDQVANLGAQAIQMWFERIQSRADQPTSPMFDIFMKIDQKAMGHPSVKKILGRPRMDIDLILDACNHFYWGRMVAEGRKFDGKDENKNEWNTILKTFPQGRLENGNILSVNPSQPFWNSKEYTTRRMLLRIGRFSHFESLSVDELRQGLNIRKHTPILEMGSTRTRCIMENLRIPMPFGWLMLTLEK